MAYFIVTGLLIGCLSIYNYNNKRFKNQSYSIDSINHKNLKNVENVEMNKIIGKTEEGIEAYENLIAYPYPHPNHIIISSQKVFTGHKWECVEFVRRFLIATKKITFNDVKTAADIWKLNHFLKLDGKMVPTRHFTQYSPNVPIKGDILIWYPNPKNLETRHGHVAIVVDADQRGNVKIAEQNWDDQQWPGNYSRIININNNNLIGWIRV